MVNSINHQVIIIFMGGMFTIPRHGRFMELGFPQKNMYQKSLDVGSIRSIITGGAACHPATFTNFQNQHGSTQGGFPPLEVGLHTS